VQGRVGRRRGRSSQSGRRRPPGPGPGRAIHSRYTAPAMNRLKIVALVYVVKTLLLVIAWLVVPDLPERAMAKARETWTAVSSPPPTRAGSSILRPVDPVHFDNCYQRRVGEVFGRMCRWA